MKKSSSLSLNGIRRRAKFILAGSIAALLASHSAHAATKTWNNPAGGDFNTPGNWTGGIPVTADTGLFNIVQSGDVTLSANAIPGSINFDTAADNSSTHNLTIGTNGGFTLTFGNGGNLSVLATLTGTGKTFTIAAPVILTPASATTAGAFTIQNNATDPTNTLVVSGGISSGTTTNTETLTLAGTNTGTNTISGAIVNGGATTFALTKSGAGTWILTGANTYNGATTVSAGVLQLSGANGALASAAASALNGGSLILDNTGAGNNNNNRIADTQALALNGGNFVYKGSDQAATNSTETIQNLSGTGNSTITVSFGGTNGATLTAGTFTHAAGNATDLVNGVNLGANSTDTTSFARFISTAPTLTGTTNALTTGINAAAKNTKIVPFLVGEATSTTGGLGTATGTANTFLTYIAGSGYRPLNPTDEFTNNAITTGNNTYITSATAATANTSINSLVINGADLSIDDGVTLTNTSGALLFASTNSIKPTGTTGIYTGSAENQITVNSGITGTISAIINGSQALTKSGAGTLVLSGANTFTGATTLTTGTLNLSNQLALQNSTFTQTAGSSLVFDAAGGTAFSLGGLNGGVNILLQNTAAAAVALTVGGNNSGGTYSGILSGTGSLTKTGTGNLVINNANTYTGATVVNGGKLTLGNGATIKFSSSVTVTAPGLLGIGTGTESNQLAAGVVITGTGGVSDEINNANTTITLDRQNTYTGQTTWGSRGIITAGVSSTFDGNGNAISGPVGVNSQINFNGQQATLNVSGKTVEVGSLTGTVGGGGGVQLRGGTITFGGDGLTASTAGPISNNYLPGTDSNGTGVGGQAPGGNVIKIGAGTQTFSSTTNVNSYEGTTTIKGGVISTPVLGTSGFVAPATSTFVSGTNTVTVSSTAGLAVGMSIFEVRATGANTTITAIDAVNNKLTLSGNVGFSGTQNIVPYGFGSGVGLSGPAAANLVLDGGTLQFTGAATVNNSNTNGVTDRLFTVGSNEAGGVTGTLDASGTGALNFTNTGSIAYGTVDQARTLGLTGTSLLANTLAPLIGDNGAGAVNVIKSGVGSWTLTNANTYSGGTTVNAGTLTSTVAGGFGVGNVTVNPTGIAGTTADAATLNSTGSIASTALVTVNSNSTSAIGTVNFNGTAPTIGGLSGTGSVVLNNSGGTNLTVGSTNNLTSTFAGVISNGAGTGSLTKAGTGAFVLTGANTYSGATTINGGTLQLGDGTSGHDGTIANSQSIVDNANLTYNRSAITGLNYTGVISGSGTVTKTGSGAQTLSGINTYTGNTTVTGGALYVEGTIAGSTFVTSGSSAATLAGNNGTLAAVSISGSGSTIRPGYDGSVHFGPILDSSTIGANMTVNSLSLDSNSTYVLDLGAATGVTTNSNATLGQSSFLQVNGNLTLGGTLVVNDTTQPVTSGEVFKFIQYTGNLTGTFASGMTVVGQSGQNYTINYAAGDPFVELTVVPEANTWAMLAGGFGTLVVFQRLRRRSSQRV